MEREFDLKSVTYVLFDVDNTLVDDNSPALPSARFRHAVRRAQQQGVMVGLATARQEQKALHIIRACRMKGYSILSNGAQIYDAAHDTYVADYQISVPQTLTLMRELEESKRQFWVQDGGVDYIWTGEVNEEGMGIYAAATDPWVISPDAATASADYIPAHPHMVVVDGVSDDVRQQIFERATALSPYHMTASVLHEVPGPDGRPRYAVAFHDSRAHKYTAFKTLLTLTGTTRHQWMMVGDSSNDLVLLDHVGIGAAVANADTQVKQVCQLHLSAWDEDGAAEALEQLVAAKTEQPILQETPRQP